MHPSNCRCSLLILLASILVAPRLLLATDPPQPSLTVLMDFEAPHSDASLGSLRSSLSRILSPTGFIVDVQLKSDLASDAQFGQLVVFKMKGSCTIDRLPDGPTYDERGPLARAYTSDGTVLHFGEVECDTVRRSLQRIIGRNYSLKNQQAYGSALAMVIAHEVYHMLGNVQEHTHEGITKAQLSSAELMDLGALLPPIALRAIGDTIRPDIENR